MKVLFQYRRTYPKLIGGDTVRAEHTRQALEKLGVRIEVAADRVRSYEGFDLVHIWQSTFKESFTYARDARRAGIPYVTSTIFLDQDRFGFMTAEGGRKRAARIALGQRPGFEVFRRWSNWRVRRNPHWRRTKELLDGSAILLPTSEWELRQLRRRFRIRTPARVTPNAIDFRTFARGSKRRFERKHGLKDFVLCVGRISVQKNQLSLVKAVRGMDVPLVLIGAVDPKGYLQAVRREIKRSGVELVYIQRLSQSELADAFAAARVHVLPSWIESTGQVSLQAAAAGCPVVQTEVSPWKEYFGNLIETCRPESVRDIRRATQRTLAAPPSRRRALADRMKRFTWERSARETLKAYRAVLKKR